MPPKQPTIKLRSYFKVQLKSTEACPKFYSPSLNETTTDADGGQVVSFGDNSDDQRPRPRSIFIPALPIEDCQPIAYVNFNNEEVSNGSPRLLTPAQYNKATAIAQTLADAGEEDEEMKDYENNENQVDYVGPE